LMSQFDDPAIKSLLVDLDEACEAKKSADRERWCQDVLATALRRRAEQERRRAFAIAQQHPNESEQMLASFFEQSRNKQLGDYERRKK